jgi:hypothetical protein
MDTNIFEKVTAASSAKIHRRGSQDNPVHGNMSSDRPLCSLSVYSNYIITLHISTLMMKAAYSSKVFIFTYKSTWCQLRRPQLEGSSL